MRKTMSADYDVFCYAAGKKVHWKVSIKKTASLSEAQSAGTWVDVTAYVDRKSFDKISDRAESGFMQFTNSSFNVKAFDISWWKANIFDAANYLEVKIEFWINDLSADTLTLFGGWVEKKKDQFKVKYTERGDLVEFTIRSYQDYGTIMSAETVTAQPIMADVDGSATTGLVCYNLPGVFVTDANVTDYVLRKGIHTLSYNYNDGSPTLQLDDGDEAALPGSDDTLELVNKDATQKIILWIKVEHLPGDDATQDIIVTTEGDTLPTVWHQRVWIFNLLKILYAKIGITDYSFDDFTIKTHDNRKVTSFYGVPPESTYVGLPTCLAWDSTNSRLWMGVGEHVYWRNMTTHDYTDLGVVSAGYTVVRLFGEKITAGKLYGIALNSSGAAKIFWVVISNGSVYSSSLTNRGSGDVVEHGARAYAYAGSVGAAGAIFYSKMDGTAVYYFDLDTSAEVKAIDTPVDVTAMPTYAAWSTGEEFWYQSYAEADPGPGFDYYFVKVWYDTDHWTYTESGAMTDPFTHACWNEAESKAILFCETGSNGIYSYDPTTDIATLLSDYNSVWSLFYFNNKVYFTGNTSGSEKTIGYVASDTITPIAGDFLTNSTAFPLFYNGFTYDSVGDVYYFLAYFGRQLFKLDNYTNMYIDSEANFDGMNVWDAIKDIAGGFLCMPRVRGDKTAIIRRRIDEDGTLVTSGETVELNRDNLSDISEETGIAEPADIVFAKNDEEERSYDGSDFGSVRYGDEKEATVNNRFIPTLLLEDYAFWFYKYFSVDRKRLLGPTPPIALFQYESGDGAEVVSSGNNVLNDSGVITAVSLSLMGQVEFEVEV